MSDNNNAVTPIQESGILPISIINRRRAQFESCLKWEQFGGHNQQHQYHRRLLPPFTYRGNFFNPPPSSSHYHHPGITHESLHHYRNNRRQLLSRLPPPPTPQSQWCFRQFYHPPNPFRQVSPPVFRHCSSFLYQNKQQNQLPLPSSSNFFDGPQIPSFPHHYHHQHSKNFTNGASGMQNPFLDNSVNPFDIQAQSSTNRDFESTFQSSDSVLIPPLNFGNVLFPILPPAPPIQSNTGYHDSFVTCGEPNLNSLFDCPHPPAKIMQPGKFTVNRQNSLPPLPPPQDPQPKPPLPESSPSPPDLRKGWASSPIQNTSMCRDCRHNMIILF